MTPLAWGLVMVAGSLVAQAIALWLIIRWVSFGWLAAFVIGVLVGGFIAFMTFMAEMMKGARPTWYRPITRKGQVATR